MFCFIVCTYGINLSIGDRQHVDIVLREWNFSGTVQYCDVMDYGAVGNGRHDDTEAVRGVLMNCNSNSTIHVIVFPENSSFLTGAFNISSNQILLLQDGSSILGYKSTDSYYFPLVQPLPSYPISTGKNSNPRYQGFVSSYYANRIAIVGSGIINGHGEYWWKIYDNDELTMTRPRLFELAYSSNIIIRGVTLKNSAFWCLHLYSSNTIWVDGITIENPVYSPNTDGIDIDSSSDCLLENLDIHVADDHISIKAGQCTQGYEYNTPSKNILIRNSFFGVGAGLAIGSETSGGIYNVTYFNNTMRLTDNGPRMKTCPHYGNPVKDIVWDSLYMEGFSEAVFLNSEYECSNLNTSIPNGGYHNIQIRNMTGLGLEAGKLTCYEGGCTDFLFENVSLETIVGFHCQNVTGVAINTQPQMCFENPIPNQ